MTKSFSIWLTFPQDIKQQLETVVRSLAEKHKSPIFEPHITLISQVTGTEEHVTNQVKVLAKNTKAFNLGLTDVDYSTTYYQSVFVRITTSLPLIKLRMQAQKIFDIDGFYMPHTSLVYGNFPPKVREKIAKSIKLPRLKFKVDTLVVTPSGESVKSPQDWIHLASISLKS